VSAAEADLAQAWDTTLRALRQRWVDALVLNATAQLSNAMRNKLAAVCREGRRLPLYSAAIVAFPCEVGELATDESDGVCLCWVDMDTGTLVAEGPTGGPEWRRTLMETATRLGYRLEV
jgi:hypothetical protein